MSYVDAALKASARERCEDGWLARTVLGDVVVRGAGARMYLRTGVHLAMGPEGRSGETVMLVGEIDGVRLYVTSGEDDRIAVILTREDILP